FIGSGALIGGLEIATIPGGAIEDVVVDQIPIVRRGSSIGRDLDRSMQPSGKNPSAHRIMPIRKLKRGFIDPAFQHARFFADRSLEQVAPTRIVDYFKRHSPAAVVHVVQPAVVRASVFADAGVMAPAREMIAPENVVRSSPLNAKRVP